MLVLAIRADKPEAELYLLDKEVILESVKWLAHRELSNTIHKKTLEILNKLSKDIKDLEGLIVFQGPGSFTGLRIGAVVANTLAYALDIPVVGAVNEDWLAKGAKMLLAGRNDKIVLPRYGREANITTPRK